MHEIRETFQRVGVSGQPAADPPRALRDTGGGEEAGQGGGGGRGGGVLR